MQKSRIAQSLALAGLLAASAANAATLAVDPLTSSPAPGGTVSLDVNATNTTGNRGWNLTLQLPTGTTGANVVANTTTLGALGSCTYQAGSNRVVILAAALSGEVPAGTACSFDLVVDAGATDGQVLVVEQTAAPGCTAVSGTCTSMVTDASAGDPGTAGVVEAHVATVGIPAGPALTAPANTTLNLGGGTIGNQVTGSIQYTAAGGDAGESSSLSCTAVAPATIVSGNNQTVNTGSQPAAVVVGITLTNAAQSGSVTCNGTTFTVNADAGTPVTGPTLTAPAGGTTVNLGATSVGSEARGSIQYSAAGGNAGQTTNLACTANAPATIVSGGNQTVATGSQPAPVVVGVVLGAAAQTATVSCNAGGTVTAFTINAPAGIVFVPPAIVPASSLWSQFALIALFAALGGVFVSLRRNG